MRPSHLCLVVESGSDVRLVQGLAARFQVTVIARRIEGSVEISHPPAGDIRVVVGPASRIGFARMVLRVLGRPHGFDAVLVQGYSLAALAANVAARRSGIRTTMLVCSPTELYYRCRLTNPQPDKPFRRHELVGLQILARLNARLGQRYVVLSHHLADVVRGHGGSLPIDVIPVYGVDTDRFAPPTEPKRVLRQRMGLPTTGTLIFFSSRIAPEKDAETLLAAVRRVLDRGHEIWILHRSGGYQGFRRDAERFGVGHRVIATDAVHPCRDLPLDYQVADLCVQASREEGLGFSPLEALATEIPVIATGVGGLQETIVDGRTGWTYPVGDVAALADRIEEVIGNPAQAAIRARAGRELVRQEFAAGPAFDRLETVLLADPARIPSRTSTNGFRGIAEGPGDHPYAEP